MKIVLLEDDQRLADHLVKILSEQSWAVIPVHSLESLDTVLKINKDTDLTIMDRLIGTDDSSFRIPSIKISNPKIKILILSSINLPEEKAKLLNLGADEYMGKPVSSDELIARINLLFRRVNGTSNFKVVGQLTIDQLKHQVSVQGKRLDLTSKEYQLLALFADSPGRIFSRNQILETVWQMNSDVESNVVESTITHLRRKLELENSQVYIKSKRHFGYWLEV